MTSSLGASKEKFRTGHRAQAIVECEALCRREPGNREARRTCALMHALTRNHARALELLQALQNEGIEDADLLFNVGTCERELGRFGDAARTFASYTGRFPQDPGGWAMLADCKFELGEFDDGRRMAHHAVGMDPRLAPELASPRIARGDAMQAAGKPEEAAAQYKAALAWLPGDAQTLKKATLCLLESNRAEEAIELCRAALAADPDNLTARLGAEWVLSQVVPLWHMPMMNEQERNDAFFKGLQAAVNPGQTVVEIGTGSGLLAMMAAKLGARQVFTCEAVPLIARTAGKIIERNGYHNRVTVLAKPSQAVLVGPDLPERADLLVHEIFSSELLGENVLPAIEDAKARLLKPGGRVLPSAASIMIALVTGDELAPYLHVAESFGFDLRDFNQIHPRKRPLYREDLTPVLMSEPVEAFRFDFAKQSAFPAEKKLIEVASTGRGRCLGVIQWIRIELGSVVFENHPSRRRAVSNWQHTVFGFGEPVELDKGSVVTIRASHDRARPWFDVLAPQKA